eukprot:2908380-Heterocapsa_arctica.AAC.1
MASYFRESHDSATASRTTDASELLHGACVGKRCGFRQMRLHLPSLACAAVSSAQTVMIVLHLGKAY